MAQLKIQINFYVEDVEIRGVCQNLLDCVRIKGEKLKKKFTIDTKDGYLIIKGNKVDLIALHNEIIHFTRELAQKIVTEAEEAKVTD